MEPTLPNAKTKHVPPLFPADEEARLEDLYSLGILDSAAEAKFDLFTEFLVELLDMPTALISLVDKDRQWFKAAKGLDLDETPRDVSFCGHAILQEDVFIVPDALRDDRFRNNPLVTGEPGIRFYAGAVVKGPSGHNIGTCCVIDETPRELTENQSRMLRKFAAIIQHEIRTSYEIKKLHEALKETALFDPMSGMPARALFLDRVRLQIEEGGQSGGRILLAFVRLDQYTRLEGMLGAAGAGILVRGCRENLIKASGANAFVGRWQDDTLSLVVPLKSSETDALTIMDRIAQRFHAPMDIAGTRRKVVASIGASVYPDSSVDESTLIENALSALRSSPVHESVHYSFFTSDLETQVTRSFQIEEGLRNAIKNDELHLVYQPKIGLENGRIVGSEALLRWTGSTYGFVSPAEFIPIAEQSGQILDLGTWVLRKACTQYSAWVDAGLDHLPISVNVTSRQLRDPSFHAQVKQILEDTGMPPAYLKLEVTEGSLIDDIEGAIKIMKRLREIGIAFSIDDFGTGYSSLSYLNAMPLDELKIDKAFIDTLTEKGEAARIVQGIIMLAHSLRLNVVSEGVENAEQLIFLRAYHCDEIQGYLFSPPVLPDEFASMVRAGKGL